MSMLFMEKEFQEAGYETSRWRDDMEVLVVHNYMTEDEFAQVWKVINETPEEDWSIHYRQHLKQFCLEKFGRDDVENLVAEGKYEITLGWDDKNYDVSGSPLALSLQTKFHNLLQKADPSLELAGFATLQRMQEGVQLKSHTDQHTDPSIKYAAILYLNDDYTDGTLFFKNKDIDFKKLFDDRSNQIRETSEFLAAFRGVGDSYKGIIESIGGIKSAEEKFAASSANLRGQVNEFFKNMEQNFSQNDMDLYRKVMDTIDKFIQAMS